MMHKKKLVEFIFHHLLPGTLTFAYVLFGLTVPVFVIYFPEIGRTTPKFFTFVSFVLTTGPITLTVVQILNFRRAMTSIRGLAMLYLEIILMFGVIYFYLVSSGDTDETVKDTDTYTQTHAVINGVDNNWVFMLKSHAEHYTAEDRNEVLRKMFVCFQDCVHFSLITSTTVGYGDMTPAAPVSKLVVDIQVLVSFFLISFGVAYFFSRHNGAAGRQEIEALKKRIAEIEDKVNMRRGGS